MSYHIGYPISIYVVSKQCQSVVVLLLSFVRPSLCTRYTKPVGRDTRMKHSVNPLCMILLLLLGTLLLPATFAKKGDSGRVTSGKRQGGKNNKKVASAAIPRSKESKRKAGGGFLKEGLIGNIARKAKGKHRFTSLHFTPLSLLLQYASMQAFTYQLCK